MAAKLIETASQTAGPYVHIGLAPGAAGFDIYAQELGTDVCGPDVKGIRIRLEGMVLDGTGEPVKDALLEVWQANADGQYADRDGMAEDGFRGWCRVITDFETGAWRLDTIKPGRDADGHAPHLNIWIVARGINTGLHTRIYFADETAANAGDPLLQAIGKDRRTTLIATHDGSGETPIYRFDIRLQGTDETVFFDV